MKKFLALLIGYTGLLGVDAHAETVTSGSKYPVVLSVFKGDSNCKPDSNELNNIANNAAQTYKRTKGNIWSAFGQALNSAVHGSGCEQIGKSIVLYSNKTVNLPVGSIVLAYKDPGIALKENNKFVNPLPALCQVMAGASIVLETRKSEGLRGIIGIAGDGGLKCTFKKGSVN